MIAKLYGLVLSIFRRKRSPEELQEESKVYFEHLEII